MIKKDPSHFLDISKGLDVKTAEEKFEVKKIIDGKGECIRKENVGKFLTEVMAKVVGPSFSDAVTMAPTVRGDLFQKTLTFSWAVSDNLKLLGGK